MRFGFPMRYYGYGLAGGFNLFNPTILLLLAGTILSLYAQHRVNSTFKKYQKTSARCGMTGAQAAMTLLHSQGIYDVRIQPVSGSLTDHYDPSKKTLSLSEPVINSTSLSAVAVAAHECGHAMQDAEKYVPLTIRTAIVPIANFGSSISWPLILIGLIFGGTGSTLCQIGILCFSLVVLFQLVTLPVEFNASTRALNLLEAEGILAHDEDKSAGKVLRAAALTYVASAATMIFQLLRLILIYGGNRRDR